MVWQAAGCLPPSLRPPPPTLESETLGKLMWSGEEGEEGRGGSV